MTDAPVAGRVAGKVAVITGAASGIGQASAALLAAEGAHVVVADIDGDAAVAVAADINARGGSSLAVTTDVADPTQVDALMRAAVNRFGALDILHNNAAVTGPVDTEGDGSATELDVDHWHRSLAVSLDGHLLGCRFAVPHMIAGVGGSIVNTASTGAWAGDTTGTAQTAAAGAIVSLTRSVATQYGKRGIRCNAVAPGLILTAASETRWSPEDLAIIGQSNLLPRHGRPLDVANAVLFLASDEAAFISGLTLRVDGGQLAHLPHYAYLRSTGGMTTGGNVSPPSRAEQEPTEKAEGQRWT